MRFQGEIPEADANPRVRDSKGKRIRNLLTVPHGSVVFPRFCGRSCALLPTVVYGEGDRGLNSLAPLLMMRYTDDDQDMVLFVPRPQSDVIREPQLPKDDRGLTSSQ